MENCGALLFLSLHKCVDGELDGELQEKKLFRRQF